MKRRNEIKAFFGRDVEFEGKLSFSGMVRIDGRFRGEIFTEGVLIVGESAVIESEVRVGHLIINGEIRGNIKAEEKIEMHKPAKVFGNIQAPVVVIDEGVLFEGNCHMQKIKKVDEKKLALIS